jgi:hypothetical protein
MKRTESDGYKDNRNDKWYDCYSCGPARKRVEMQFVSGSVEPTDGETLTGATSGDTGVVDSVELVSGTYAGGDAAGWIELKTYTGADMDEYRAFQADESINGSTGGDGMLTVAQYQPSVKITGRKYRESDTVVYKGRRYCRAHFNSFIRKDRLDEIRLQGLHERDRNR